MDRASGKRTAVAAAAVTTALLVGLAVSAASPSSPAAVRPAVVDSPAPAASPRARAASAPVPPASGAWVGAWVRPEVATPEGRQAAVAEFEELLGRELDVVHVYHQWDDPFPSADDRAFTDAGKTLLLSWAGTDTREIQAGVHDVLIRERARQLRDWGAPVLLQWRWEMDRPNLQGQIWSPEDYVAAWKHIRAIFDEERVSNAAWVWCPLANGFASGRAQPYYPGDDQVDWLCADTYPGPTVAPFAEAVAPFLDWARSRPLPIIIGEFGMKASHGELARQEWLAAIGEFVKTQPQIKGLVYFDADRSDDPDEPFDMSLRTAPGSMQVFRRLAQDPYYRPGSS